MAEEVSADTLAEADATPQKAVKRWLLEISLAQKREKKWREKAKNVLKMYRGEDRKKNSFNILWANTEVMRPALYNSPPKPDVRRRFRQNDPLGKAVSEVMERSVSYCVDAYDLDNCLQNDVLDSLLPGRGLSRIRYVPKFKRVPQPVVAGEQAEPEADREELEYEQALCEHVQWDDFLCGAGKTWEEVQWVSFRHRLTRDDLREKFGKEIGDKITLNDVADDELHGEAVDDQDREVFKRAEVWEIWDKEGKKVFFLNQSYKENLLYPLPDKDDPEPAEKGAPPLALKNFFPIPRPLQLVEDTGTLVPTPLYELYKEQAEELDRISARINKIVNACKVRFVFDSTLTELKALMDAGDNDGVPTESARAWMTNGGIDKAIWWMPVEKVAQVLKELYIARDSCKIVIYEITGLSDILRGATDPNETLGAQKMKANSSSLRLQRMVAEVQRYTRDLIRLLAEVIGENFDPQTLAQMTGLQFPTNQQKQAMQLQMQAMPQQPGQPPDPRAQQAQQMLAMPSWEDIMAVLRSDIQREYRVDVETDSTVAQSLQQDMEGMREVFGGLIELWTGAGPAVMSGAVSIEVIKAMSLSIARRARMGLEVEDALEQGMQQPKPQDNGEGAKAQAEAEKVKAESAAQAQKEAEITKREAAASQEKVAVEGHKQQAEVAKHAAETKEKYEFERWKAELENDTKITVAEIQADAKAEAAEAKPDAEGGEAKPKPVRSSRVKKLGEGQEQMRAEMQANQRAVADAVAQLTDIMRQMHEEAGTPPQFTRGADGKVSVIKKGNKVLRVARGADGRATHLEALQ